MFSRKYFAALAVPAVAAAITLGGGAAAMAATPNVVSGHLYYTNANVDPVAGYFASSQNEFFTHIQSYLGGNGTDSRDQLAAGYTDGQTVSLCDQSTGQALNAGLVKAGTGTESVGYHVGQYNGEANNFNGDPCEDGELNGGLGFFENASGGPALQNIPITDTIWVQVLQFTRTDNEMCHAGQVEFEAQDVTANPGVWYYSGCKFVGGGDNGMRENGQYNEASVFTSNDSMLISAPDSNYLDTAAHIGLTDSNGVHGSLQSTPQWTAFPVEATGNGLASGQVLEGVGAFSNDHFDTMIGSITG